MSHLTSRILAYLALALMSFTVPHGARASVGDMSGGALSSFGRLSPVQTVQYGGGCWYDDGWNGPGYYPCGNELNTGLGGVGPDAPIVGTAIRRRHHHGVVVAHPHAANPVYPGAPSRRLGVGVPSVAPRAAAGSPAFGAGGVRAWSHVHAGTATVTSGFSGGGFHGDLGGGNFHQFHGAGFPHIGAPVTPGFAGHAGLHGLGAATGVHIEAPASPGFAGVGGFHAGGGVGVPHIGASASPGLAGGGFHGVGGRNFPGRRSGIRTGRHWASLTGRAISVVSWS
jgi:hypothetical protein